MIAIAFVAGILCLLLALALPFHLSIYILFFGLGLILLMISFDRLRNWRGRR